jgi:hypothetical protein
MTIGISKIMVGIDGSEESVNAADYANPHILFNTS